MTEEKSLIEQCYEQVFEVSHNPSNIEAAQQAGGALSASIVGAAAIEVGVTSPAAAVAAAEGVHGAYNYGHEYGDKFFVPLEAAATMATCAPNEFATAAASTIENTAESIGDSISNLTNSIGDTSSSDSSASNSSND